VSNPVGRGRLFRKYVVVLLVLVGGVLMASSLVELYFSYRETQRAIVRVERAKAVATAARIEQFLKEVEAQVRETTRTASDDPDASQVRQGSLGFREGLGAAMAEQRELDFLRVLRNVASISELSHLDLSGKEQLRVSRLEPDVRGSQADLSRSPAFVETKTGKTYWSPVHLKNDTEPYVTLAIPVGKYAVEVTTAEVSLGAVLKMVSQIEAGPGGYAYVVDSRDRLVAHPDHRILRSHADVSGLAQVKSARAERQTGAADAPVAVVADGLGGGRVLAAHAPIGSIGWLVFVEHPAADAYAPLRDPVIRSAVIFVLGLGLSILASLLLARRMVAPIRRLQEGATRIGAGDLRHRIEVRTGDELEALGEELNRTAGQLEESYANLEKKVEERTRELAAANDGLTETLEQQTATSEILRVISRSPTDVEPVLAAVVASAARLCGAEDVVLLLVVSGELRARAGVGALYRTVPPDFRIPLSRDSVATRAVADGVTLHVDDLRAESDVEFPVGRQLAQRFGHRTMLAVPLLREGAAIGVICAFRLEVRPFPAQQIALLQTFADQAVIAIENVRLFNEIDEKSRALEELSRNQDQLARLSTTLQEPLSLAEQLTRVLDAARQVVGLDRLYIWTLSTDGEGLRVSAQAGFGERDWRDLIGVTLPLESAGALTVVCRDGEPLLFTDAKPLPEALRLRPPFSSLAGLRVKSFLVIPMIARGRTVGVLAADNRVSRAPIQAHTVDLLQTFAAQAAVAVENARLFQEIQDKGRELELASKHKSQFLANMSHELRTPMNAVLGYTDLILDGIFGDVPEPIRDTVERIKSNGQHLLGLINDVLDLSKMEAGQLTLSLGDYTMDEVVYSVVAAVESLAAAKKLALDALVPPDLPPGRGDERRLTQVLLNLTGNAIKFTDTGRVAIEARADGDAFVVSVSDTGPGIAEADRRKIFEEFQQADSSSTRTKGGTGLGLSISRRIVELHGGRLWVESVPGEGSTFHFSVPIKVERGAERS
jgi:signal transduction histidine kinase